MLDQLDHLDLLDDASPPDPDAATLARVRGRATGMRHRRQFAGVAALVIVLAVAGGVTAIARRQRQSAVSVPGSTTTAPKAASNPTTEGTLPNGLHIEMSIESATVQLGRDVEAKVVVRNDTHVTKTVGPGALECALGVGPILRDSHGISPNTAPQRGANCLQVEPFPPGKSATFTTALSTNGVVLPNGANHERFDFSLVPVLDPLQPRLGSWSLPPVMVDVVAPALSARIEVTTTTAVAGGSIRGSLVFDNTDTSSLSAGCSTHRNYELSLAAGDTVLANPFVQLNPDAPCVRSQLLLPPGKTSFPFTIPVKYYGCSSSQNPMFPRCVGHLQTPPLPAGQYEIQYKGAGAVGAVDVTPVTVEVTNK